MFETRESRAKALREEERLEDQAEDAADRRAEDREAVRVTTVPEAKPKKQEYPKWVKLPFVNEKGEKSTVDLVANSEGEASAVQAGHKVVKCVVAQTGNVYTIE